MDDNDPPALALDTDTRGPGTAQAFAACCLAFSLLGFAGLLPESIGLIDKVLSFVLVSVLWYEVDLCRLLTGRRRPWLRRILWCAFVAMTARHLFFILHLGGVGGYLPLVELLHEQGEHRTLLLGTFVTALASVHIARTVPIARKSLAGALWGFAVRPFVNADPFLVRRRGMWTLLRTAWVFLSATFLFVMVYDLLVQWAVLLFDTALLPLSILAWLHYSRASGVLGHTDLADRLETSMYATLVRLLTRRRLVPLALTSFLFIGYLSFLGQFVVPYLLGTGLEGHYLEIAGLEAERETVARILELAYTKGDLVGRGGGALAAALSSLAFFTLAMLVPVLPWLQALRDELDVPALMSRGVLQTITVLFAATLAVHLLFPWLRFRAVSDDGALGIDMVSVPLYELLWTSGIEFAPLLLLSSFIVFLVFSREGLLRPMLVLALVVSLGISWTHEWHGTVIALGHQRALLARCLTVAAAYRDGGMALPALEHASLFGVFALHMTVDILTSIGSFAAYVWIVYHHLPRLLRTVGSSVRVTRELVVIPAVLSIILVTVAVERLPLVPAQRVTAQLAYVILLVAVPCIAYACCEERWAKADKMWAVRVLLLSFVLLVLGAGGRVTGVRQVGLFDISDLLYRPIDVVVALVVYVLLLPGTGVLIAFMSVLAVMYVCDVDDGEPFTINVSVFLAVLAFITFALYIVALASFSPRAGYVVMSPLGLFLVMCVVAPIFVVSPSGRQRTVSPQFIILLFLVLLLLLVGVTLAAKHIKDTASEAMTKGKKETSSMSYSYRLPSVPDLPRVPDLPKKVAADTVEPVRREIGLGEYRSPLLAAFLVIGMVMTGRWDAITGRGTLLEADA